MNFDIFSYAAQACGMAERSSVPDAFGHFYQHAGFDWAPGQETREQGRTRCAAALAQAEARAELEGYTFDWGIACTEPYVITDCYMFKDDRVVATERGIALANEDQRRVIEAQLAMHHFNMERAA